MSGSMSNIARARLALAILDMLPAPKYNFDGRIKVIIL